VQAPDWFQIIVTGLGLSSPLQVTHLLHTNIDNLIEIKVSMKTRCQWLMPVILATWEAEIRRIRI
jgi:hypothetical protein